MENPTDGTIVRMMEEEFPDNVVDGERRYFRGSYQMSLNAMRRALGRRGYTFENSSKVRDIKETSRTPKKDPRQGGLF